MNNTAQQQITIRPIISYPHEAEVGKMYLLTIDIQTDIENWPYPQEDYALHCVLETEPLFSYESLDEPVVILNRFGGTYGPAAFVITASLQPQSGAIRINLVSEQGLLLQSYNLPDVRIAGGHAEAESTKSESYTDGQNLRNSIVAILGTDKLIRGTGFVVSESHILTCAHVVRSIGTSQESLISVQPYNSHDLLPARVVILSDDEDVAVMKLETPLPEKMRSVICDLSKGSESHHFKSFGFVSRGMADAVWIQGSIKGLLNQTRLLQLQSDGVEAGMSGAPVLDNLTQRVVGMISMFVKGDSPISSPFQLNPQEFNHLVTILASLPEFRTTESRVTFLDDVLTDLPSRNDILGLINLDGAPRGVAVRLITRLIQFGKIEPGKEALGMLINKLLGYISSGPDTDFLRGLFHTYPALDDSFQPVVDTISNDTALAISMERIQQVWPDLLFITLDAKIHQYCQDQVSLLASSRYQIDSRFVQLTLLVDQGPNAQGIRFIPDSRKKYDNLKTLLADIDEQFVVILGPPGSGKTSLLRRLQYEQSLWIQEADISSKIPFFIPLNAYSPNQSNDPPSKPIDWLTNEWHIRYPDMPAFDKLFEKGSFLLLLDGLNEMPHRNQEDYHNSISQWRLFLQQVGNNTVVFSCRSLDYSVPLASESVPVRQVIIEPLQPAQVEEFISVYLEDSSRELWEILKINRDLLALLSNPFLLRLLVDQFRNTGILPSSRAAVFTAFVRRALYREVERGALFEPNELLTEADLQQIRHNKWTTPFDLPSKGLLIPLLEKLAFAMQSGGQMTGTGMVRIPEKTALVLLEHPNSPEIISAGIQLNILDKDISRQEISYFHQFIQEYFAARFFTQQPEPEKVAVPWRVDDIKPSLSDTLVHLDVADPLPPPPSTGWEETVLLSAELASDQEGFVNNLLAANLPLAARCAATSGVQVSPKLLAKLQQKLINRINDVRTDLRSRIGTAEALGTIGDPRFSRKTGTHGSYLVPPLTHINSGIYTIGGDDTSSWDDEKPAHAVNISSFQIGVFPVTNAEFSLFIEAGGYDDERWWHAKVAGNWRRGEWHSIGQKVYYRDMVKQLSGKTDDDIKQLPGLTPEQIDSFIWLKNVESEELERQLDEWFPVGKIYRQPEYWNDSRFNQPTYPVVGITWFEACAYCAWLSTQAGKQYRLPSEVEWEASAGAQDGRIYPYGNQFDVVKSNTFETHIRGTTPVGIFPRGRSRNGIEDLSGNVNEWTTSNYLPYPYQSTDGREDEPESAVRKVIRGGSWSENSVFARIKHRQNAYVDVRMNNIGFRVVSIQ